MYIYIYMYVCTYVHKFTMQQQSEWPGSRSFLQTTLKFSELSLRGEIGQISTTYGPYTSCT